MVLDSFHCIYSPIRHSGLSVETKIYGCVKIAIQRLSMVYGTRLDFQTQKASINIKLKELSKQIIIKNTVYSNY